MAENYDEALRAFAMADEQWRQQSERLLTGAFCDGEMANKTGDIIKEDYLALVEDVQQALEERNIRLKEAQNILRQKVALAPTQWRGPKGKPTLLNVGAFKVTSVTKRSFDPKALFRLCQQHGLYERLMELKTLDKDGKEKPLVQQEWDINYEAVLAWLESNQLQDVIDGAYDEKESTPQVKGPKALTFLGDEVK
jgi:hypothetical protein